MAEAGEAVEMLLYVEEETVCPTWDEVVQGSDSGCGPSRVL